MIKRKKLTMNDVGNLKDGQVLVFAYSDEYDTNHESAHERKFGFRMKSQIGQKFVIKNIANSAFTNYPIEIHMKSTIPDNFDDSEYFNPDSFFLNAPTQSEYAADVI